MPGDGTIFYGCKKHFFFFHWNNLTTFWFYAWMCSEDQSPGRTCKCVEYISSYLLQSSEYCQSCIVYRVSLSAVCLTSKQLLWMCKCQALAEESDSVCIFFLFLYFGMKKKHFKESFYCVFLLHADVCGSLFLRNSGEKIYECIIVIYDTRYFDLILYLLMFWHFLQYWYQ